MNDPRRYIRWVQGVELRPWQKEPLLRITDSIERHLGDTIVLMFPRQSGKDEMLIQLKAYLLHLYAPMPVRIVEINPTYEPQTKAAIRRFDVALAQSTLVHHRWRKQGKNARAIGRASVTFLSGDRSANIRGAPATLLLVVNEAQDIDPAVFAEKLEPMTASTNATRVIAGTAWTSDTLLAQELRAARNAEQADGRRRVFTVDADGVRKSLPLYGEHVDKMVSKYGREHPAVKTQYFNEEIDARGGMFNAAQIALMRSAETVSGAPGSRPCAFLLDVAGQEEAGSPGAEVFAHERRRGTRQGGAAREARDSVTLRIVEIDLSTLPTLQAPSYRAVLLKQWTGENHLTIFGQLKALAESWRPQHIVMDATGVGEGLWAMLDRAFPTRVTPVKFTQAVKSELGYGFLAIINSGRFRDLVPCAETDRQYAACESEILIGPQKTMRWGVPDGRRDADGKIIHDDIPVTDSLTAILDRMEWRTHSPTLVVRPKDPLDDMSHFR